MATLQMQLNLEPTQFQSLSLVGMVREVMLQSEWATPYEIQRTIERVSGAWHSDSSITARMRELRRPEYGGYDVERRKREGTKSFEYRLQKAL